jgi:WD40 repeat protein
VVQAAQFSPDGKVIVTTTPDGKTRVWDVAQNPPLPERYDGRTVDNMPVMGSDNFKILQDQIDALRKRVEELEKKAGASTH